MEERLHLDKLFTFAVILILFFLAFLVLKPVLMTVFFALILVFLFFPIFEKLNSLIKVKSISAIIICVCVLLIIVLSLVFAAPPAINQTFNIYTNFQKLDIGKVVKNIAPEFFSNPDMYAMFIANINTLTNKLAALIMNSFTNLILNSATIFFHIMLIFFVLFFGLKDGDKLIEYLKGIFPFAKEHEEKVFRQFKQVTNSVVLSEIVGGFSEGLATGIIFLIFGVPNTLVLTLLAIFFAVLPIIGTWAIWVPVVIYLLAVGRVGAAFGIFICTPIIVMLIDAILKSTIVSKRTNLNPAVSFISMIGGLLMFGVLGLIFGPLIISYLLLFLEVYRQKKL